MLRVNKYNPKQAPPNYHDVEVVHIYINESARDEFVGLLESLIHHKDSEAYVVSVHTGHHRTQGWRQTLTITFEKPH